MSNIIDLSIVIPVYNSADIFPELYRRVVAAVEPLVKAFEIIAVLDGCHDRSCEVISQYHFFDQRVKLIEFSRNFGQQAAISAGLKAARGKMVVVMDDDLEDPPEQISFFIEKMNDGFDVVYGIRRKRKRSFLHRLTFRIFYRILGHVVNLKMPYDAGDFCIMRDKVVSVLNAMPERNRYLRGLRTWSGFRQTGIEYAREERFIGASGYGIRKYIALALDAMFSFSYKPLKFISVAGFIIAVGSFFFGAYLVFLKLTDKIPDVPGWASLAVSLLFLSGIQMVSVGIMGEYISRIYDEVKQRPQYVIQKTVGLGEEDNGRSEK